MNFDQVKRAVVATRKALKSEDFIEFFRILGNIEDTYGYEWLSDGKDDEDFLEQVIHTCYKFGYADCIEEKRAYRKGYLRGLREHTVPFTELNDYTKEMIGEIAKDDYSKNHKNSATDLIEYIYGDEDVSPELTRKTYNYYCDVYSELQSHSEDDDYFDDEWEENEENTLVESKKINKNKKPIKEGNRIGNNEFVPDFIDQFLEDVAQYSNLYDYEDIIAFERDVFAPNDKNVKALKKLYRQFKEALECDDEKGMNQIYQDVADLVIGVVDYEA